MKLLWVAADKIGSRLIRWGLDSDCSHFAVCFDEGDALGTVSKGIVFHSYGKGTQLSWLKTFLRHYTVVHALEPVATLSREQEEAVYAAVLEAEDDRAYDYPGLLWFAWRGVLFKLFGWAVGGVNRWQRREWRLCTGVAPTVLKALGVDLKVSDPEMVPPHDLYLKARFSGQLRDADDWREEANLV